jgi:hypothetical protein
MIDSPPEIISLLFELLAFACGVVWFLLLSYYLTSHREEKFFLLSSELTKEVLTQRV